MTSIRRNLLAGLLASVLIAGALAAGAVYYRARHEAGEILDYQLRQMALSLRDRTLHSPGSLRASQYDSDFDFAIDIRGDDGSRLHYSRSRVELPPTSPRGYATVDTDAGPWRVYTLQQPGFAVRVAQPMGLRNEIAVRTALRTMTPFLLLVPILWLLVWLLVTHGLKPLESLAAAVKARSPSSLRPLEEARVPEEIEPVVASLNDLLARLTRALEHQRAFVADAAHALRTPLTALNLQIQLAERADTPDERAAAFATLKDGVSRATHLVEQLLTLARNEPEAGERPLGEVDLGELASDAVAAYSTLAEAKGVDLGLVRRDPGVAVAGDLDALKTLLSNLVDNALRYTPAGGRVDVAAMREAESIVLEVTDTGPGIPAEERERVFDRFYRVGGNDVPGSGLGLAIVRSIAQRYGAKIALNEGADRNGLSVRVSFPAPVESVPGDLGGNESAGSGGGVAS
jgi:two-component system OmpR family sensor kinase